jgi:hypothetical protein
VLKGFGSTSHARIIEFEIKSLEKKSSSAKPAQKNRFFQGGLLIITDATKHNTTIVSGKTRKFKVFDRKKNIVCKFTFFGAKDSINFPRFE